MQLQLLILTVFGRVGFPRVHAHHPAVGEHARIESQKLANELIC
jgi:hypothetical protein